MPKITPHLWFDSEAKEAAEFYTATFPDSKVTSVRTIHDTPSGDCDIVSFELFGQPFMAISAGPLFKFTPAISFSVSCPTKEEVHEFWNALSAGGETLMPLQSYPFSDLYGWTMDRYGLSWQVGYAGGQEINQRIIPALLFAGEVCGRAEEAINFYSDLFPNSEVGGIFRYGPGEEPDREGTVKYGSFTLDGQQFSAMDSGHEHEFGFNEAISLMVECGTQEEIDHFWDNLTAVPEAEQCGWLKDKFGVSWQVTPDRLDEMLTGGSQEQVDRVTRAFLQMKKFDLAELDRAYEG
ncbi:MAG TPA: VOC family protein [Actinomycetota bacterium]|jgi:predicted 3-demethylubiquinone-9 3-methyltransferase (glyoxalase superfamily)|nr:VOC family protein [Actinomycetota bacterium]